MSFRRSSQHVIRRKDYGAHPFRLSLRYLDSELGSPWAIHELSDEDMADIGKLLAQVAQMTWEEIGLINDGRGQSHGYRSEGDLSHRARERFRTLPCEVTDQNDSLFRFKVTTDKRLWGFVVNDTFYVLWWDPKHEVSRADRNA